MSSWAWQHRLLIYCKNTFIIVERISRKMLFSEGGERGKGGGKKLIIYMA